MRKILLLILCCFTIHSTSFAWGGWGHPHINYSAVFPLPAEMRLFFYNHIDYLMQESVGPDIRKYTIADKAEYPRHYIDIEVYDSVGNGKNIPRDFAVIKKTYSDSFMQQNGILPWYIQEMMTKLTASFKAGRTPEILFLAADLAHYLGDANMPLHTSVNHDGQFTGQRGIHGFWESQLPEMFGDNYNLTVGNAQYISDISAATWDIINYSHSLKDSLLSIESNLKAGYPVDKIYAKDSAGNIIKSTFGAPVHADEYAKAYHIAMKGMVERQMRKAISDVTNFWYTAWVNAGKPDLNKLDTPEYAKSMEKQYKQAYSIWQKGKLPPMILFTEYSSRK